MRIFKYPQDIDTGESAYCIISAFPWRFQLQKSVYNASMFGSKDYRFHFLSYVPKELAYSNSPVYRGIHATPLASAFAADTKKELYDAFIAGGASSFIALANETMKGAAEMMGLDKAYETTKEQIGLGKNIWMDPRMVNSFQEPDNVSQKFTYQLLANDDKEATDIKLLVNTFKYSAQPERESLYYKGSDADAMPLLRSPLLFDVQVFTPEQSGEKSFSLVREYNFMNLVSIDIKPITDASRVDVPFYFDGNTIGYELGLSFKSIHPVIRPKTDADDDNDQTILNALKIVNGTHGEYNTNTSQSAVRSSYVNSKKVQ